MKPAQVIEIMKKIPQDDELLITWWDYTDFEDYDITRKDFESSVDWLQDNLEKCISQGHDEICELLNER